MPRRRTHPKRPVLLLGAVLLPLSLVGCTGEVVMKEEVPTPGASASESTSSTPSGPTSDSTAAPSDDATTTVGCASASDDVPGPLAESASQVELGRLSVGPRTRVAAENFAVTVAQFFVDARGERNQAVLIDDVASPDLPEASRDRFVDAYDDERQHDAKRHLVTDAEVWMRSCVVGRPSKPREVQVEVVGVVDGDSTEAVFVTGVRVDVAHRAGRWEVLDVAGPEPRSTIEVAVQGLEPLLEGRHWRQVPPERGAVDAEEEVETEQSEEPDPTPSATSESERESGSARPTPSREPSGTPTPDASDTPPGR